jgi:hypothetical protein
LEGVRDRVTRYPFCTYGQSFRRCRVDQFGDHRVAADGSNIVCSVFLSNLARAFSDLDQFDDSWGCAGDAIMMIETGGERWYQAEAHRIAGGDRAGVGGAGRSESGSAFRARARHCLCAAGKVLGTARRNEHGAALARPGQGERSARNAGSGLRVVHRRLRHARSERGEGAAGGVGVMSAPLRHDKN